MSLKHPRLIKSLQMAYSAEKAAAYAYQGHANCVKKAEEKKAIKQIEIDEWNHRAEVLHVMKEYDIPISSYYEFRFEVIGKIICYSCYIIGWFMPFYFAGRLESGNVCEYFHIKYYFNELGITKHDQLFYDMGIKEKEHEIYFYEQIKNHRLLPFFEKIFSWGAIKSLNDIDLEKNISVTDSNLYCKNKTYHSKSNTPSN